MPRRYRPPTRRRKQKKATLYGEEPETLYRAPAPPPAPASARPEERSAQVAHISRDHSYVLGELKAIGLIVAFILAGLIITAVLR